MQSSEEQAVEMEAERPERRRLPSELDVPPPRPGGLWSELRQRRFVQIVASYAAAGWIAMEVLGSLVERGILPEVVYRVGLTWYVGGLFAAAVIGWIHGERGHQRAPRSEIAVLGVLFAAVLVLSAFKVNDYRATRLARAAAEAGTFDLRRIAVLYFRDGGLGGEQYLADAVTEELIDELSRVRALDVISANGVVPFRNADVPADSVAKLLRAGTVVQGMVERRGEKIRVDLRLIDGASGAEFRRAGFEHPAAQLQELGTAVAEQASHALREWLGEEVRLRESKRATENVAAWSQLQRAEKRRKDAEALVRAENLAAASAAFDEADALAAKAEALDPRWVAPLVIRAEIAYRRAIIDRDPQSPWITTGLEHAERAVVLAPNEARALAARGTLRYWRYYMPAGMDEDARRTLLRAARADLEEAVRIDPALAPAHATLSNLYYDVPDVSSALLAGRRAYEEDAYLDNAAMVLSRLFFGSLDLEQFGEATRWCREGAERFPTDSRFALCHVMLMATPAQPPEVDRAWRLVAAVDSLASPPRRDFERLRAMIYTAGVIARAGLPDSARAVLRRIDAEIPAADPTQMLFGMAAYPRILLGDLDGAVNGYKRYLLVNPSHGFKPDREIGWWWRPLREHPRFPELLARPGSAIDR